MFQQSLAQLQRTAQKATSIVDDRLPDRQRGMWSFLTWSFFLAQAVASHEAYAKGQFGGDAGQDGAGSSGSGDDAAAHQSLASAQMFGLSGFDLDPSGAALLSAAIAAGAITPQMWAAFQADPGLLQAFVDSLKAGANFDVAMAQGLYATDAGSGSSGEHGHGDTGHGDHGTGGPIPGIDLPGIIIPGLPGITLPIQVVTDLGLELGGIGVGLGLDTSHGLDANVQLNVGSLLGLDAGVSLADGIDLKLDLLGMHVSLGGEGSSLGSIGTLLSGENGALSSLHLDPVINTVTHLTGLAPDVLSGPINFVTSATSSTLAGLNPITQQASTLISDVTDMPIAKGLFASGGSIVQTASNVLPSLSLDDLFSNGHHTSYGLAVAHDDPLLHGSSDTTVTGSDALDVVASAAHDLVDDSLKSLLHGISHDWSHG